MSFTSAQLSSSRPASIRPVALPRRQSLFPSPADWRDEVLYFLLPDRFSDGQESTRPALDRGHVTAARPGGWMWNLWSSSGADRYQGGTLRGLATKLDYLKQLGATTIWVGPVFKQRSHEDTFHGYAIQDFLEVDARLGSRQDLVDLVAAAHSQGMRVILDIIFNHSGCNWIYANGQREASYLGWPAFHQKGPWLDRTGGNTAAIHSDDDGVWPTELQQDDYYTRAGTGNLGEGNIDDPHAEHKRTDFLSLRDFNFDQTSALDDLARCYKYWIALTDCDGFRIDTLKHVSQEVGRNFCGNIKEFAANLGKADFFLVGEVAGSDGDAARYRDVLGSNLNATLDIGGLRPALTAVAKGLTRPSEYFDGIAAWDDALGSHRLSGKRHVSILDDHDHVSGSKTRFSTDAASDHQVTAGVALQLFSLGIPCVYYGTEQAFAGPEKSERDQWLSDFGKSDRYLREAMFGPTRPRASGLAGLQSGAAGSDAGLPGFGPFGTVGHHCFDTQFATFRRIAALIEVRNRFPVLRYGRQYQRPISNFGHPFELANPGELITWSRILDDEEVLCVVNGHGNQSRGGDVLVARELNSAGGNFQVVLNTAEIAASGGYHGTHARGQLLPVKMRDGAAYVEIRDVGPSEVLLLANRL